MTPDPSEPSPCVSRRWDYLGFLLLLALPLPLKLWRMSLESSTWVDEVYTYLLSQFPVARIIDITTNDAHPPLQYLLVKAWYHIGRWFLSEPGILWGRGMNLIPWAAMAAAAWFGGRALLGRSGGTLFAWVVMLSAQIATATHWLRGYAVVCPALFICFMLLLLLDPVAGERLSVRRQVLGWALYAACGSIALWSIFLSAIVLLIFGLMWLGALAARRDWRSGFALGGFVAQSAIVLGFLPWLPRMLWQYRYFQSFSGWIPDARLDHWVRVFVLWYPAGQIPLEPASFLHPYMILGALSLLVPIGGAIAAASLTKYPTNEKRFRHAALRLFFLGCGAAFGFVTLTWALQVLGLARTFYGPRYPALTAALWAAGLAAIAFYAARRFRLHAIFAWVLLVPWFVASFLGQASALPPEFRGGVKAWKNTFNEDLLSPSRPLYVMPSNLIPFYRRTFRDFDLRPFERLADLTTTQPLVVVFDPTSWSALDSPSVRVAQAAFRQSLLSDSSHELGSKPGFPEFRLFVMKGFDPNRRRDLLDRHFAPAPPAGVPSSALAVASVPDQFIWDGWSDHELASDLTLFRWGISDRATLRFDRTVPPGDYVLHFIGYRKPFPEDPVEMVFRFEGERESYKVTQPQGYIGLQIPVRLERPHSSLRLRVGHPLWRPCDFEDSNDPRRLSVLYSAVWLESPARSAPGS